MKAIVAILNALPASKSRAVLNAIESVKFCEKIADTTQIPAPPKEILGEAPDNEPKEGE